MSLFARPNLLFTNPEESITLQSFEDPSVLRAEFILNDGQEILIRPCETRDVLKVHEAINTSIDSLSYYILDGKTEYTTSQAKFFVENNLVWWQHGLAYEFFILDKATDKILGSLCLNPVDALMRNANLGYWLIDTAKGKGMASLAALFGAHVALNYLNLHRVYLLIHTENLPSIAVAKRIRAVFEGVARKGIKVPDGYVDGHVYSFTADDFKTSL